jgi:hypothetical protein
MARRVVPVGVVVAVVLAAAGWPRAADPPARPAPTPADGVQALGVASCAAMACHHGNGPRGAKSSEYSTWVAVDPHAKAYRVLFNADSRRMHQALAKHDAESARHAAAHLNPLCLKCHGMGDGAPQALHADGVGCERCHGPASAWKSTHYLPGFNRATPGFKDLRTDLAVRAEVCVDCHVGKGDMQVDHDLIAAGHPRLRFEYSGYYASYPRHWGTQHKGIVEDEPTSWLIGQLTSAQAALELLADRAGDERREWPEFAEYACAACHQALKPAVKGGRGELPWGTWYNAVLPDVATDQTRLTGLLTRLGGEMKKRSPGRATVREDALAAAELLGAWRKAAGTKCLTPGQARALAAAVARLDRAAESWDGAAQLYLSLTALSSDDAGLAEPLKRMRRELVESFPAGARPLYDTPANYSSARLQEALKLIRRRLESPP